MEKNMLPVISKSRGKLQNMKDYLMADEVIIEETANDAALNFLRRNRSKKEQIAVSGADKWYGAYVNDELAGVIGLMCVGSVLRIKGFFVAPVSRNQGIGGRLLARVINGSTPMSAFATERSHGIFLKYGFIDARTKRKNGIVFMVRSAAKPRNRIRLI
jgi:GNAT superfamily N-acetyltransferase